MGPLFGRDLQGTNRLTKTWYDNSVLKMVNDKSAADLSKVRYWIDCGDDDQLSVGNSLLHVALMKKNVSHEFRIRNGAHNWTYWRTGITDALQFIGWSFRQQ
jgi:enterochelin esterase-like enzyme